MRKGAFLYEGKAKKIYAADDPSQLWIEYKDDATAFEGVKKIGLKARHSVNEIE